MSTKIFASLFSCLFLSSSALAQPAVEPVAPASVAILSPENTLTISGEIGSESYRKLFRELKYFKQKNAYIYIDSLGGSVIDGAKMIHLMTSYKKAFGLYYTCLIQDAASMAFAIVQSVCDDRVISPTSVLMQHQIAFATFGQIERIDSTVRMVRDLEQVLNQTQAERLGLTVERFKELITNDWFLVGEKAIKNRAADRVGYWLCVPTFASCPLK